jgi:uncharacterized membrane protein
MGVPTGRGRGVSSSAGWLERVERWALQHWLALFNTAAGLFAGLPVLAPILLAAGLTGPALLIYAAYGTTCHQWPGRSYFLFGPQLTYTMAELDALGLGRVRDFVGDAALGFKVAYCERDFAIYTTIFLAGLLYSLWRARWRPLSVSVFVCCLLPMALDGGTQLVGLRESSWELRSLTGALASLAAVALVYPRLDRAFTPMARPATALPGSPDIGRLAEAARRAG